MFVLRVDNRYFTDADLCWNSDIKKAEMFSEQIAKQIQEHWMKNNTVLSGIRCNNVVIEKYQG